MSHLFTPTEIQELHIEGVQERILEILSKDKIVQEMVLEECLQRFPGMTFDGRISRTGEEIICLVQLRVYRAIMEGIV